MGLHGLTGRSACCRAPVQQPEGDPDSTFNISRLYTACPATVTSTGVKEESLGGRARSAC